RKMLTLLRDPFGVRSLYYTEHRGVFYFASELKQLLAIPDLPARLDPAAIHKYLTFSFVPGEDVPVQGVRRLLPGRVATWREGRLAITQYFVLKETIDPALEDRDTAVEAIRQRAEAAVVRRLNGEREVGLYLSGGIDASTGGRTISTRRSSVRRSAVRASAARSSSPTSSPSRRPRSSRECGSPTSP